MDKLISCQVAIDLIENFGILDGYSDRMELIDRIKNLPSAQPEQQSFSCGQENDAISRQWLMECVNEGWIKFDTEKDANTYIHLVRDIAPSTQPEPQWIPCSKKLPEERGRYLVTVDRRQLPEKVIPICIVLFKNGEWLWDFDDRFIVFPLTIKAWMPLLEPYGGEQDG